MLFEFTYKNLYLTKIKCLFLIYITNMLLHTLAFFKHTDVNAM